MILQFRVDMFLMPNNEKIASDFIMRVCVYLRYIHLQNKSKTNDFLYQFCRLFVLLKKDIRTDLQLSNAPNAVNAVRLYVRRMPSKIIKSKFLYPDYGVLSLASKGMSARCFVCKDYDKNIHWERRVLHELYDIFKLRCKMHCLWSDLRY